MEILTCAHDCHISSYSGWFSVCVGREWMSTFHVRSVVILTEIQERNKSKCDLCKRDRTLGNGNLPFLINTS